ncbi:MAG: hypothetical protein NZ901_07020 [Geminocystis sp.]|nr:hypothetical protein [Geminocystis sp.]MCS7147926.1 hypothetical protein [Geminocystis sp.]MCX8078753.1 hypothetical protein [Geminocystis sp.]MDW8116879.1 hypothetical protein [Geminocystis sp.]MDW8462475.1 hypothetical protein [Geminocystis sp.]
MRNIWADDELKFANLSKIIPTIVIILSKKKNKPFMETRWKLSWQTLSVMLALTFGSIGFFATMVLLRLPSHPNCSKIALWFSSATSRIYCAQLKAKKNTVEDLLEAIELLRVLSPEHPLRNEINRNIAQWSNDILELAEEKFQQGDLEKAIAIARKIPTDVISHGQVEEKIKGWRRIWEEGEKIVQQVEAHLQEAQWNQAFLTAVELLNLDNEYWQTVKYQELVKTINLAREESRKLDGAYLALRRGGLENLLKVIEIASTIPETSYSYKEASKLIQEAEEKIVAIGDEYINASDWDSLSELAAKIPEKSGLHSLAADWKLLASAGKNARLGTVSALELAMAEVSQIPSDSRLYPKIQNLIAIWDAIREDLSYLTEAEDLAKSGEVADLLAAITKAQAIDKDNPLYQKAQKKIKQWQEEIQLKEDRPILEEAKNIAQGNNIQALQTAIQRVSRISSERALYKEARALIRQWQRNIERLEDIPILQQAQALAESNRYQEAIQLASRITRGRALYRDAQRYIRRWRREISAQEDLRLAYSIAQNNDPQSLLQAIEIAQKIPSNTSVASESRQAIEIWSEEILNNARRVAESYSLSALEKAIAIANTIPPGTSAYVNAQQLIENWRRYLYPGNSPDSPR